MPSQHSSLRSRVRQWCRQFRGLVDRFGYARYDFVDASLIGRDGRLHPVASFAGAQPSYPTLDMDDTESGV